MSSPRIGPPGSPNVPVDSNVPDAAAKPMALKAGEAIDKVTQRAAPKSAQAGGDQPTTAAFAAPAQPTTERRARFGGERGAWTARTRQAILFAADNPDVGQELLAAFARGVA